MTDRGMTGLPLQLHETPDPDWDGIPSPDWTPETAMFLKPAGFWTSSATLEGSSDWKRWNEGDADPRLDRFYEVSGGPRVLVLRDDRDLLQAMRDADAVSPGARHPVAGDFDRLWAWVRLHWDAVHVPGDRDRRSLVASWDCESTVWFHPHLHLALAPAPEPVATLTSPEPPLRRS